MKRLPRTPKNYDGIQMPSYSLQSVLAHFKQKLDAKRVLAPQEIVNAWPHVVGPHLAPMTEAVSFLEGVLWIQVKNSSLYSLLSQYEAPRLLRELRSQFPSAKIRALRFRVGMFNAKGGQ